MERENFQGDTQKSYTEFHKKKKSIHLYPTEWVIRTMLGTYPELYLDKSGYTTGNILDLGFGDCRNMSMLQNCGLTVFGMETTEDIVKAGYGTLDGLDINADLRVGTNANIPFENDFFDYLLASSSCYYIDGDTSFKDNLREISRVLKPGGQLIANFPALVNLPGIPTSFILNNAELLEDDHVVIKSDIYGIRNGYTFKTFKSKEDIVNTFKTEFIDISTGYCLDNYYGVQINSFIMTAKKR